MRRKKSKASIEFDGFEDVIAKLTKLEANTKNLTEKSLRETHKIVTQKAEESVKTSNLPAKGKYSTGDTEKSLKQTAEIEWEGFTARLPVGFSISKGGLASIFMMYGTPRYMKNQKMWNAFWSKKTRDEIKQMQEDMFYKEIRRLES